jgi:hypothetical protein
MERKLGKLDGDRNEPRYCYCNNVSYGIVSPLSRLKRPSKNQSLIERSTTDDWM